MNSVSNLEYDAVCVGDALPELHVLPTLISAVMYSAAMWEFQKIHYDHEWSRTQENLDGPILQGPMLGNYLARMLTGWAGPRCRLTRLTWRNHGVAPLGEALVCTGRVTGKRANDGTDPGGSGLAGLLECEIAIVNARDRKILSGTACVAVPLSSSSP